MRRVAQRRVFHREAAGLDVGDLAPDRDHRLAETVDLGQRLGLGRLDHQRAGHREAHRRRVEAVVDQALGDVVDADANRILERARVNDALVRHAPAVVLVQHREVRIEAHGNVIGVQDRDLGRALQALGAHHQDVGVADRQDRGRAEGRSRHRAHRRAAAVEFRVPRQEGRQVRAHADRAHARAAAAVRDAEGLVKIQMRDVGAEGAGLRQAHLRVHVGAVHVDLAAVVVDHLADRADLLLEHAVGRRIGDHQRGEVGRVLLGLRGEVGEVDVAVGVAVDDDHLHADHLRRRRVGAVRRRRNQAHVAVALAARAVVAADRQQARVLALRARVRLQRDRVVAGDVSEPA